MIEDRMLQEELAAIWAANRMGVLAELELIGDADLDFRPAPESRTVRELVHHIAEAERVIAGEALRPDGDFMRLPWPGLVAHYAADVMQATSKAELVATLSRHDAVQWIRQADPAFLRTRIRGITGHELTRLSSLAFGNAHEFYHRGQLALCVRMLGQVPALTRSFQTT